MRDTSHLIHTTFDAPAGVREFKTVTVRELDGKDEKLIALWVRQKAIADGIEDEDFAGQFSLSQQESIRMSIVEVDGQPVNLHGAPFKAFDDWTRRAKTAVQRFHNKLNGVDSKDLEKCAAAGRVVDPPTAAPVAQQAPVVQQARPMTSTGGPEEG